jgi:hypothetical protein
MASSATNNVTNQTDEDHEHNEHLALQEHMSVSCRDDRGYHVPQSGPATVQFCSFCGGCGARGKWSCQQQPLATHHVLKSPT